MRFSRIFVSTLLLLAAASATELKLRVLDPSSAAVAGAQVELLQQNTLVSVTTTSVEGLAVFHNADHGPYRVRVLAPGFAPLATDDVSPSASPTTVRLRLSPASETVVVSATRGPVPSNAAGAVVESLSAGQLQTMRPVATNEALRLLPGTVIETAGQRGGLSSLFVRGGDSRYTKVMRGESRRDASDARH